MKEKFKKVLKTEKLPFSAKSLDGVGFEDIFVGTRALVKAAGIIYKEEDLRKQYPSAGIRSMRKADSSK